MHDDDVRVPDARELASFVEDSCGVAPGELGLEEFQCDGVIQPHVVCVEDLAKSPRANLAPEDQMSPAAQILSIVFGPDVRTLAWSRPGRDFIFGIVNRRTMQIRDLGDNTQVFKKPSARISRREFFKLVPLD